MKEKVGFFSLDVVCTERSIVSWMKTVLIFNKSMSFHWMSFLKFSGTDNKYNGTN